jgi:nucleoside-diphosphate-sugar epimerase
MVRASRVVVISTVDVYPSTMGVDESSDCHSAPNHAYGTNRLYFEDAMRGLFQDVTIIRISGVFGPHLKKNVIYDLIHENCTDRINPESSFQYYNVSNLWRDLQQVMAKRIRLINFVSEPIRTREIIQRLFPDKPFGSQPMPQADYDVRTLCSGAFDGPRHYLFSAQQTMGELEAFVRAA